MARNQFYSELVGALPYERRNALSKIRDHIKFILANDGGIYRDLLLHKLVVLNQVPRKDWKDYGDAVKKEIDELIDKGFIEERKTKQGLLVLVYIEIP